MTMQTRQPVCMSYWRQDLWKENRDSIVVSTISLFSFLKPQLSIARKMHEKNERYELPVQTVTVHVCICVFISNAHLSGTSVCQCNQCCHICRSITGSCTACDHIYFTCSSVYVALSPVSFLMSFRIFPLIELASLVTESVFVVRDESSQQVW